MPGYLKHSKAASATPGAFCRWYRRHKRHCGAGLDQHQLGKDQLHAEHWPEALVHRRSIIIFSPSVSLQPTPHCYALHTIKLVMLLGAVSGTHLTQCSAPMLLTALAVPPITQAQSCGNRSTCETAYQGGTTNVVTCLQVQ